MPTNVTLSVLAPRRGHARPPARVHDRGTDARRLLADSHGRVIRDLRLSITDRCNFRCVYCMDPGVTFAPREELLSVGELARVARLCVGLGVRKIRITGGEPTVHPRLTDIIRSLAALPIDDLAMTTNGAACPPKLLEEWRLGGLRRLTLSIDSVDPVAFARITRSSCSPATVIAAAKDAQRAGLGPVKLNAVIVRDVNEDQVVGLARLARDLDVEMRFIEFMPLDSARAWDRSKMVPAAEIVSRIDAAYPLLPLGRDDEHSTALEYGFADGSPGRIGIIAPVTRPFCGACSRLRITADGKVRPCLFSRDEWDARALMRSGADDEAVEGLLLDATWSKQAGHGISATGFQQPARPMSAIGG